MRKAVQNLAALGTAQAERIFEAEAASVRQSPGTCHAPAMSPPCLMAASRHSAVLHSLAHFPANSHISSTINNFSEVTFANGMADGERS